MDNVFTLAVTDHLDFYVNYSRWLQGDEIIFSQWRIQTHPESLTITNHSFTSSVACVWLQAVSAQQVCEVVNQVTTQQGRKRSALLLFGVIP